MTLRALILSAGLAAALRAGLPDPAAAAGATPAARRWLSAVVTRIGEADRPAGPAGRDPARAVEVRIRVGGDGSVLDAQVDRSSGSRARDARAVSAVRDAGPFPPPPAELLTADGTTELSFPLERPLERPRNR